MAYANVAEPFMASVHAYPHKTAVIFKGVELSYAQMNEYVNQVAHVMLDDLGVKPGDRVAYLLPNCIEILVIYYAIQKIGAVAVPLNFKLIAREVDYLVEASGSKVLFFADQLSEKVVETKLIESAIQTVRVGYKSRESLPVKGSLLLEELAPLKATGEPELFRDSSALSRVQYTGGSTGLPKGAARTHHADLVEFEGILDSNGLAKDPDNVVLIQCPLEHHGGHSWFTITFAAGATLVICDVFEAEKILYRIQKHHVTYMILLPPITYLRLLACPTIAEYDLSSVKLVQSSAGGTTKEIIEKIYEHFPNAILNYGWGQSESGLGTSLVISREMLETNSPRLSSIGRPMKGLTLKIVDDEGVEVPQGVAGEALVFSEAVMNGYFGQDDLTARVFTKDGWLKTGDMMVEDAEGYLTIKSRKKDMIKSGGENVFIAEVERTINSHPAVADCLVFGTDDAVMGEAVAAVVQLTEGSYLSATELQEYCKQHIASYKKPRYLTFIDDLGRDDAGKVRKQKIIDYFDAQKAHLRPHCYEQIQSNPDVFHIPIPFSGNPLKYTNVYLIRTDDRNLLIDAGVCQEKALCTLKTALRDLKIDMNKTDILLTHFHVDHIGLAKAIAKAGTRIFLSETDSVLMDRVYEESYQQAALNLLGEEGLPNAQTEVIRAYLDTYLRPQEIPTLDELYHLEDGASFMVGPYELKVINTPGHTPGHQCFYLPAAQIMFYGDHLLMKISPNVTVWPDKRNTLADFLQSLKKVAAYPVALACMGHGGVDQGIGNEQLLNRIEWLEQHHEERLNEIATFIAEHPGATGTEIARSITWNIPYDSWDEISLIQKWFTISETIAHLEYLVDAGSVVRKVVLGKDLAQKLDEGEGENEKRINTYFIARPDRKDA